MPLPTLNDIEPRFMLTEIEHNEKQDMLQRFLAYLISVLR